VPPLSKRLDDIPILTKQFIAEICEHQGKAPLEVTEDAFEALKKIRWTGNIRELRNVIERLVILCDGRITEEDVRKYSMSLY
jgi:DNA-binding NtrC family response regulator